MPKLSLFKIHGGKFYLAKWIISHFPANYVEYDYVENFFGAGSVLLQKKPSFTETAYELNLNTFHVWNMLQTYPGDFAQKANQFKYKEHEFTNALDALAGDIYSCPVRKALGVYVIQNMSRGGLGEDFAWSERLRGGIPGDVNAWNNKIKQIPEIYNRIRYVRFNHGNGIKAVLDFNNPNCLIYEDPPYLKKTRVSKEAYDCEMTEEEHEELAKNNNKSKAKIMISGYRSDLYDKWYSNWRRVDKEIVNHSSQAKSKKKKIESIWMNY